jgi:hypothetical protein
VANKRSATRLAHELLISLDQAQDADASEAWLIEIDRRSAEVAARTAVLHDWNTVRQQLAQRWRKPWREGTTPCSALADESDWREMRRIADALNDNPSCPASADHPRTGKKSVDKATENTYRF